MIPPSPRGLVRLGGGGLLLIIILSKLMNQLIKLHVGLSFMLISATFSWLCSFHKLTDDSLFGLSHTCSLALQLFLSAQAQMRSAAMTSMVPSSLRERAGTPLCQDRAKSPASTAPALWVENYPCLSLPRPSLSVSPSLSLFVCLSVCQSMLGRRFCLGLVQWAIPIPQRIHHA